MYANDSRYEYNNRCVFFPQSTHSQGKLCLKDTRPCAQFIFSAAKADLTFQCFDSSIFGAVLEPVRISFLR